MNSNLNLKLNSIPVEYLCYFERHLANVPVQCTYKHVAKTTCFVFHTINCFCLNHFFFVSTKIIGFKNITCSKCEWLKFVFGVPILELWCYSGNFSGDDYVLCLFCLLFKITCFFFSLIFSLISFWWSEPKFHFLCCAHGTLLLVLITYTSHNFVVVVI